MILYSPFLSVTTVRTRSMMPGLWPDRHAWQHRRCVFTEPARPHHLRLGRRGNRQPDDTETPTTDSRVDIQSLRQKKTISDLSTRAIRRRRQLVSIRRARVKR